MSATRKPTPQLPPLAGMTPLGVTPQPERFDPAGFWAHADATRAFSFPTGDLRAFTVTAKAEYDPFNVPATPEAFSRAQADAIDTAAKLARWSTLRTWEWGYDAQGEPVPQGFAFMVSVTVQEQEPAR